MTKQEKFNDEVNEWLKELNRRLSSLEQDNRQMETEIEMLHNNQECDNDTINLLIAEVEQLTKELKHIKTKHTLTDISLKRWSEEKNKRRDEKWKE